MFDRLYNEMQRQAKALREQEQQLVLEIKLGIFRSF
jgi:hypothetical protein